MVIKYTLYACILAGLVFIPLSIVFLFLWFLLIMHIMYYIDGMNK